MDPNIDHQKIEKAFRPARELVEGLPEHERSSDAERFLKLAEAAAHDVRETMPPKGLG